MTAFTAKHHSLPWDPATPAPACRVKLSTTNATQHNLFQLCCAIDRLRGLMRLPFLHTQTTFLKPSESKSCFPRNAEATGPSLFPVQAAWKPLQLQPPPSPSSLNLPVAPALGHGLAAEKQLHIEKMLPSPSNTRD